MEEHVNNILVDATEINRTQKESSRNTVKPQKEKKKKRKTYN